MYQIIQKLASNVVDHGFEPWSCQTKDYNTGIYCFSATLCIDGHFFHQYQQNKQRSLNTKNKNVNRPGLGQTQKCGGVKQIQVNSAPSIVIWAPR
jgi:hypothetical protein